MLLDEEDDLLRFAVKLQRLDARGQRVGGRGVRDLRQTACGGVQTDAPYRSTTSAVPRWCAPCVRSTRTVLPCGSKLPS